MHNAYYIYCAKMKLQHIYANFLVVVVIVNVVTSYTGTAPLALSPSPSLSLSLFACLPFLFFLLATLACYFGPVFVPGPVCSNLCKFFISLCG